MEDLGSKEGTGSSIHATVLPGFDSRPELPSLSIGQKALDKEKIFF